jgi:hypothetical protein
MPSNKARANRLSQQVVVEEVEMPSGEPIDFGQRGIDALCVERSAALEEGVFVAEVTVLGAAARDDDRVGDQVAAPGDQIAANRRQLIERASGGRLIDALRVTIAKILQEGGKRLLARAEDDRVGMRGGFVWKRRHVQAAEGDEDASGAVVVREPIGAVGVGDVDLNQDEVGPVVDSQRLDVLIDDRGVIVWIEEGGERGQAKGREEGVLDRPPVGAGRLGERRQDQLYTEVTHVLQCTL